MDWRWGRVVRFLTAGAGALVIVILAVVIFLALTVSGCGDADTTREGATDQTPAGTSGQLPLLDLEAPATFETASFALG